MQLSSEHNLRIVELSRSPELLLTFLTKKHDLRRMAKFRCDCRNLRRDCQKFRPLSKVETVVNCRKLVDCRVVATCISIANCKTVANCSFIAACRKLSNCRTGVKCSLVLRRRGIASCKVVANLRAAMKVDFLVYIKFKAEILNHQT
jgi:hypothetical protein